MEKIKELTSFYEAVQNDPRIGPTHISVYMALFQLYNLNEFKNPVYIDRKTVMQISKINGFATFHKCIKDLIARGYIQYFPSNHRSIQSRVNLIKV